MKFPVAQSPGVAPPTLTTVEPSGPVRLNTSKPAPKSPTTSIDSCTSPIAETAPESVPGVVIIPVKLKLKGTCPVDAFANENAPSQEAPVIAGGTVTSAPQTPGSLSTIISAGHSISQGAATKNDPSNAPPE